MNKVPFVSGEFSLNFDMAACLEYLGGNPKELTPDEVNFIREALDKYEAYRRVKAYIIPKREVESNFKIKNATVLWTKGPDKVFLEAELLGGVGEGGLPIWMEVTWGCGKVDGKGME